MSLANGAQPIWHPAGTATRYAFFRSPEFQLPVPLEKLSSAVLYITAQQSPNLDGEGTLQSKLLCAYKLHVNGIMVSAGPGHNVPSSLQAVNQIDVLGLLRPLPASNVLAVAGYFNPRWGNDTDPTAPRLLAQLLLTDAQGGRHLVANASTGPVWRAWAADKYFNPDGDNGNGHWYHLPNEDLDLRVRQVGWTDTGFSLTDSWVTASPQPAFTRPLHHHPSAGPTMLWKRACSVTVLETTNSLLGPTTFRLLLDFGMELMGGVNLTFSGAIVGGGGSSSSVVVVLGEELLADGGVMSPLRTSNNYTSRWTLAEGEAAAANAGITQHEFVQFRYAEVRDSPEVLTPDTARAWVVQHSPQNPFEKECARSTPNIATYATPLPPPSRQPQPAFLRGALHRRPANNNNNKGNSNNNNDNTAAMASFNSSSEGLNAVWNLTAYTAVAVALDVNVDSQTRQRDMCQIDAAITAAEQYAVFPGSDAEVQRRSAINALGNDTGIWSSCAEFKNSAALMAHLHGLETGDTSVARLAWSDSDASLTSDSQPLLSSLQFLAGVRYYNSSGSGLLHFPADCGGAWNCSMLADWPISTQDSYVRYGNPEDAIRNGLGAVAIRSLAEMASWMHEDVAAARYTAMVQGIQAGLVRHVLRYNISAASQEAYFTDGVGIEHAAVHSTVYAVVAGVADGNATLARLLTAYLVRKNLGVSSCMTARWYVQALYQLAVHDPQAADFALELLSRTAYPSWGYMVSRGATTTLEAWAPEDKWNTDWAHPWCASPAFLIPRWLLGAQPLATGWTRFRVAPQPGNLTVAIADVPTPLGAIHLRLQQADPYAPNVVQLFVDVPEGATAQVCLPPLHPDLSPPTTAPPHAANFNFKESEHMFVVDKQKVETTRWGRLICTVNDLPSGGHVVMRW